MASCEHFLLSMRGCLRISTQCPQKRQARAFAVFAQSRSPYSPSCTLRSSEPQRAGQTSKDNHVASEDVIIGSKAKGNIPIPILPRPIGLTNPPRAGENTGVDSRSLHQRSKDWVDEDKSEARRAELRKQFRKPYFREWQMMDQNKGKHFLAPTRLLKATKALYMPNLRGATLASDTPADTAPLFLRAGPISIVTLFTTQWSEEQTHTWTSASAHPVLQPFLSASPSSSSTSEPRNSSSSSTSPPSPPPPQRKTGTIAGPPAQLIELNFEENPARNIVQALFKWRLRRMKPKSQWSRFFMIRKGITDRMREAMLYLNRQVGYVYLVDGEGKIRWAGCGYARDEERESMIKCLERLIAESAAGAAAGGQSKR